MLAPTRSNRLSPLVKSNYLKSLPRAPHARLLRNRKRYYQVKITNPKRVCLACGLFIAANRWGPHCRSDACIGRVVPVPERCACGRKWPCLRCTVLELLALGFSAGTAAQRMGITEGRVHAFVVQLTRPRPRV